MNRTLFFLWMITILLSGITLAQHRNQYKTIKNADYALALSSADRFLTAWQFRRQDEGLALLSDGLKKNKSEEDLFSLLVGTSNPHHESYEICSGKQLKDGRFSFAVTLYETITDEQWCSHTSIKIIMIKAGKENWLVDELP